MTRDQLHTISHALGEQRIRLRSETRDKTELAARLAELDQADALVQQLVEHRLPILDFLIKLEVSQ